MPSENSAIGPPPGNLRSKRRGSRYNTRAEAVVGARCPVSGASESTEGQSSPTRGSARQVSSRWCPINRRGVANTRLASANR